MRTPKYINIFILDELLTEGYAMSVDNGIECMYLNTDFYTYF